MKYCAGHSPVADLTCNRRESCKKYTSFLERGRQGSFIGIHVQTLFNESLYDKCTEYENVLNEQDH